MKKLSRWENTCRSISWCNLAKHLLIGARSLCKSKIYEKRHNLNLWKRFCLTKEGWLKEKSEAICPEGLNHARWASVVIFLILVAIYWSQERVVVLCKHSKQYYTIDYSTTRLESRWSPAKNCAGNDDESHKQLLEELLENATGRIADEAEHKGEGQHCDWSIREHPVHFFLLLCHRSQEIFHICPSDPLFRLGTQRSSAFHHPLLKFCAPLMVLPISAHKNALNPTALTSEVTGKFGGGWHWVHSKFNDHQSDLRSKKWISIQWVQVKWDDIALV